MNRRSKSKPTDFIHERTRPQLIVALFERMRSLEYLAAAFDQGEHWAAGHLAVVIYVLLHSGGNNSKALLDQLKIRRAMLFMCSSRMNSAGDFSKPGLQPKTYLAWLAGPFCWGPLPENWVVPKLFETWWDTPVWEHESGSRLTRKDIVYQLRTKETAHFDPTLDSLAYHSLKQSIMPGLIVQKNENDPGSPIANAHLWTIRQMTWEIMASFNASDELRRLHLEGIELGILSPHKNPTDPNGGYSATA